MDDDAIVTDALSEIPIAMMSEDEVMAAIHKLMQSGRGVIV